MPNKERAHVWKYFHKEGEKSVVCGLCGQRLAYRSSTSTMRYHLDRKHPMQWSPGSERSTMALLDSPSPGNSIANRRKLGDSCQSPNTNVAIATNSPKTTAITYFITELLIRDLLPLREIENIGFKQLVKYLEPTYTIPNKDTILSSLGRLYEEIKPNVQQALLGASFISLTTDIWVASSTQIYITISAYWVTEEWTLTSRVLATHPLSVGYTVDDLSSCIQETLTDYNIPLEHVTAVVHSDPANWPSELAGLPAVTCFGFTLQEALRKALELPPINRLISAARKLVGNVKHLSGSIVELAMQQAEIRVSEIKLQQDVNSLWYTTCTMLECLRDQRSIICAVIGDEQIVRASDGLLGQTSDQWDLLNELVEILHPLKTATEVMTGDKNVSVSSVFPILHGLTSVHLAEQVEDSDAAKTFKEIIRNEVVQRWCLDSCDSAASVPVLASILDPRYRDPMYLSAEQQLCVRETLAKLLSSLMGAVDCKPEMRIATSSPHSRLNLSALEFLLGRHVLMDSGHGSVLDSSEAELKLYMDPIMNPPASTDCDPLLWWQGNKQRFPHLAMLAKKILCVPSTAVPAQRLFSLNGLIFNGTRAQLEHECVDLLLFLNSNISPSKK